MCDEPPAIAPYPVLTGARLILRSPQHGHGIGTAGLPSLDEANRRARYAIGIFAPTQWSQGYGAEATRLVLGYAFDELSLHRVDLRGLTFNAPAITCYEKCGCVREGIEREGALIAGEWQSDVMMSILEAEYRAMTTPPSASPPDTEDEGTDRTSD